MLDQAEQLLAGDAEAPDAPSADPTLVLNQLAAALPQLEGRERAAAAGLLARPTDGKNDQWGDGYLPGVEVASAASPNFCVFWAVTTPDAPDLTDGGDPNDVPDYVDQILEFAEHSRTVEVAPGPLGWAPPKPDQEGCGQNPAERADIYLKDLGALGFFGYESPDPNQSQARSQYGYMVLDNDYDPAEYPGFADPLDAARVTFAHEYNHLLQQNYDSFQDPWMFESTATWSEEHVYPEINDYVRYVATFAAYPGVPITDTFEPDDPRSLKIYGANVWNHWLATGGGGYGVGAVRRAWEVSGAIKPADFSLGAYDRAIDDAGGPGFAREFLAFMAATAEWRTGFGGFPDAAIYPDMQRKGKLGRTEKRFKLDHTAARLFDVVPSAKGKLKLKVRADRGLKGGAALVARRAGNVVVSKRQVFDKRGRATVILHSPAAFERSTAVVVNGDPRVKGFSGAGWDYRKDRQKLTARVR